MDKLLYLFGASNASIGLAKDYFTIILSAIPIYMLAKYGAISKYGSDIPIAVIGICMKVFTIVINIVVGIILGAQPILGYNFGAKKYNRVKETFKIVMILTFIVGIISTIIFEVCPELVIKFFGVEGPLYAAPAADLFAIIISTILVVIFFKGISKEENGENTNAALQKSKEGVIITISREHGSQGKYIGKLVAEKLGIPYYYKEMTAIAAKESGLDKEFVSKINQSSNTMHDLYLTTSPVQYAIDAQNKAIRKIAEQGTCVLVGRAADYVLQDYKNLIKIFIYAPKDYRVKNVMKMYKDTEKEAIKNVEKSDKNRASYYKIISGKTWGDVNNYNLCIDSSIGKEKTADIICEYVSKIIETR